MRKLAVVWLAAGLWACEGNPASTPAPVPDTAGADSVLGDAADSTADAPVDAAKEAASEVAPETTPDLPPDVPAEAGPTEVTPDVVDVPDAAKELPAQDVLADVPLDVPPDVPADVPPDLPPDLPPDVPPGCCGSGNKCGAGLVCAEAQKVCKGKEGLQPGQCWTDDHCSPMETCQGANICPCGAQCFVADKPGKCVSNKPVPGCCADDPNVCGPNGTCANKVCKSKSELGAGECWAESDCPKGQSCEGEFVCTCGALCGPMADKKGKCTPIQ